MNAVFATQGLGLRFHYRLANALTPVLPLERRGFYVCDAQFHQTFVRETPTFAAEPHVLSEWEILREARSASADTAWLRRREHEMEVGPLWDALVCDRRMMQGRWCKERQDYRPRFTHEAFLRILTVALRRVETWFDQVGPDLLFGLVPVTFGEYLIWMVARSRGIPGLFFYPTKIRNFMCWMDGFLGRPLNVRRVYDQYRAGFVDQWLSEGARYVQDAEGREVRHEGMIAIPGRVASHRPRGSVLELLRAEYSYRTSAAAEDNHVESPLLLQAQRRILTPVRRLRVSRYLAPRYVSAEDLPSLDYVFYPLHAEPEVALSIHGRPYVNQIETVRNLARSLPAGMIVITKEHPRSIGYRPARYYEKLLRIPNVRIADSEIESSHLVRHSAAVAAVWSFVGFEGVLARKPVISLGTPLYTLLPSTMVRHVTEPVRMHEALQESLSSYEYDRQAVVHFVAACMKTSVPMNFYARHLDKQGRYGSESEAVEYDAFVQYTCARAREAHAVAPQVDSEIQAGV